MLYKGVFDAKVNNFLLKSKNYSEKIGNCLKIKVNCRLNPYKIMQ